MKNKNIVTVWAWQTDQGISECSERSQRILEHWRSHPLMGKPVKCILMTYGEYARMKKQIVAFNKFLGPFKE